MPIHYDRTFEHPKYYRPVVNARAGIEACAVERGVSVLFAESGAWHDVAV